METAFANGDYTSTQIRPEIGVCLFLCVKNAYELHPGEFFLEYRLGSGSWSALSRDNDFDVMTTRFAYRAEMLVSGESVRLVDWKGKVLMEKSK